MKLKHYIPFFTLLLLAGCRAPLNIAHIQTQKNISINQSIPDEGKMDMTIAPYKKSLENQMNTKISFATTDLTKEGDNSTLGNLLADYTLEGAREWAKKNNINETDAAVINIGGIRTNVGKGDLLLKHLFEVMPFENELVIVKMKGTHLQELFTYYLDTQKNNPVSGFIIETENNSLTKALINLKEANPNSYYFIATSDFLALGGDNMKFFGKGEMISTGIKLRDLYIQKFKEAKNVVPPSDIRLTFKGKTKK